MGEVGEISIVPNEVASIKTSGTEAPLEQGTISAEAAQADEREIYKRGNLVIEKIFRPSEKDTWPRRSIELVVSQNGQKISMNSLLPEEWTIVEDPFRTGPFAHFGENKIVLPSRIFMPAQMKEVVGLEKTESSLLDGGIEKNSEIFEAHNFLALRGSLMGILHEIGHVNDKAQLNDEDRTREETLRAKLVDKQKFDVPLEELSDTDLQDYIDSTYRSERAAWMQAFKRYRQLKKETGIDLAEGRNARKVIASGRACLTTYEGNDNRVLPMYRNAIRKQQPPKTSVKHTA